MAKKIIEKNHAFLGHFRRGMFYLLWGTLIIFHSLHSDVQVTAWDEPPTRPIGALLISLHNCSKSQALADIHRASFDLRQLAYQQPTSPTTARADAHWSQLQKKLLISGGMTLGLVSVSFFSFFFTLFKYMQKWYLALLSKYNLLLSAIEPDQKLPKEVSLGLPPASQSSSNDQPGSAPPQPERPAITKANANFLRKLHGVLDENLGDPNFGIPQLCRQMNMSRSNLHRKIKNLTGTSTSLYVRSRRLQKAKYLLSSTQKNVSEIAYEVGFKSPAYFSQVFTKKFGAPPSVYKEE